MMLLSELDLRGVIVTAPGEAFDFVSRFFRAQIQHPRRSRHRLCALRADTLLG